MQKNYILINSNDLNSRTKYNLNIILMSEKRVIIKGTVYNEKKQPSIGAVIEIIQIDYKKSIKDVLGYSYTDNKGEYTLSVEVSPKMFYEIGIYSPLIT